ncbi:PD-(D/E)XK nuclease family protein [Haloactinopolyspora sp.]|uniref:PD-(D/E)XK nuclease family protein n=1 Tax=Haloactinopolyspora sp. TaxID=1966353 RepID=UPI00262624A9|nr:PD-(D/E)XK nuclease family protein [Haloactinopolyspora sp.]
MSAVVGPEPVDVEKPEALDVRHYSVTTIIGALDKPALQYWAAEQAALAAVQVAGSLQARIEEEGEEAVVKWLRDARFRRPKGVRSSAELGTEVHAACEEYALTGQRPEVDDEVRPFLDRFDEWLQQAQPVYEAVETTVYNETFGYAGTLDAIASVGGQRVIVDYKTSRKSVDGRGKPSGPYPEVALQLAAYRHAELAAVWRPRRYEQFRRRYYLLGDDERSMAVPVPEVDGGIAIHITPEHCTAYPVRCDGQVFDAFLFALEAFRWQSGLSKKVIGEPLVFAEEGE